MAVISGQEAYSVGVGEVYEKTFTSTLQAIADIPPPFYEKALRVPFSFIGEEGQPCPRTGVIWPRNMNIQK